MHFFRSKMNHPWFGPSPVLALFATKAHSHQLPMMLMAERASISRPTLSRIEKGDSSVSFFDEVGRLLEEENLPKRIRFKKIKELD